MSRRVARGGRRTPYTRAPSSFTDPFVTYSFDYGWRADDAVGAGPTTSWPSYRTAATLTPGGTGQAAKAPSALLNNRQAIAFDGVAATGGYGGLTLGAAPTTMVVVTVGRVTADNSGLFALTVTGGVNTGCSGLYSATTTRARKVSSDAPVTAINTPYNFVQVSVFDAAGSTIYLNSKTAVTQASAGALAGQDFQIGALNSAQALVFTGLIARTGVKLASMTNGQIGLMLDQLGTYYGITITP